MAAPSTSTRALEVPGQSAITPRSSRRLLGLQSFFHHLDEAYEKKEEIEKQHHGGALDEESQQRLLSTEPVPFELSESSTESDSDSGDDRSESAGDTRNESENKASNGVTPHKKAERASSAENVSSSSQAAQTASSAPTSEESPNNSARDRNGSLNGTSGSTMVNTGTRVPLKPGSRSQTLISPVTTSKSTFGNDGVAKRPSAVGNLTSFWEKINEKEKEEAERLRVKPASLKTATRPSLPTGLGAGTRHRTESGVKLTATGISPVSPRSQQSSFIVTTPTSPRRTASKHGVEPINLPSINHKPENEAHTTAKTDESVSPSFQSASNDAVEPLSPKQVSSTSNNIHDPTQETLPNGHPTTTEAHSSVPSDPPSPTRELAQSPSDPSLIPSASKKTKSSKSSKTKESQTDASSDADVPAARDGAAVVEPIGRKRGSSRKRSGSPRHSDADVQPELTGLEIAKSTSSDSVNHQEVSNVRVSDGGVDGAADSSSQDTATTSSSKSPKNSVRKSSLVVPESKRADTGSSVDKDRGVQSDAEGYSETVKERKKKSKNAPRANSTSQLPKERILSRERKDSKSPSVVAPVTASGSKDRVSSPSKTHSEAASPEMRADSRGDLKSDSKVDLKSDSKKNLGAKDAAKALASNSGSKESLRDSPKDSPKDKSKKKTKRSSSKSSKERDGASSPASASGNSADAAASVSSPGGGVGVSSSGEVVVKAGRKKKKRVEASKKKSGGAGESEVDAVAVEMAAQSITSPSTGQIELGKLRAFFATWDPKAMTHSWEINPQEIEFVELIGEGTSCAVYRGTYRGQVVALKVLKDINTKQLTNFVKEFDIISDFRSPYVVFFFGACIEPIPVMVLGLCPRGSLYDVLKPGDAQLTWGAVVKVCTSTLRGLDSLHKWKPQIVHRDLKSRNILIEDDWSAKLCDFGESRYNTGTNLDTLCKIRGTYAYIAPEVYFGQSFTTKSDVYAFGVILWELCNYCVRGAYTAPFAEYKTLVYDFQIIVQASRKGMRPSIDQNIPIALSNIIQLCWDHEPDNRPSAAAILKFFEEIGPDTSKPADWTKAKFALHWPPPGGPGKPGAPPRSGFAT